MNSVVDFRDQLGVDSCSKIKNFLILFDLQTGSQTVSKIGNIKKCSPKTNICKTKKNKKIKYISKL